MDGGATGLGPTLVAAMAALDGDDEDACWELVCQLAKPANDETFAAAVAWARSEDPRARVVGLDILGHLGEGVDRPWSDATVPIALAAATDPHPGVASSAIATLGHLGDARGLPAMLERVGDPDAQVRFHVAVAVPGVVGDGAEQRAVDALIVLMEDDDEDVRDWATFGLGSQLAVDDQNVRRALWARLEDVGDIRDEALVGLARRRVPGTVQAVERAFADGACGTMVFQAARLLGDSQLRDWLEQWRERLPDDPDVLDAVAACDPTSREQRFERQAALLAALEHPPGRGSTGIPVALFCDRFETDVLLCVGDDDDRVWDADELLRRASQDPLAAAALVRSELDNGSDVGSVGSDLR